MVPPGPLVQTVAPLRFKVRPSKTTGLPAGVLIVKLLCTLIGPEPDISLGPNLPSQSIGPLTVIASLPPTVPSYKITVARLTGLPEVKLATPPSSSNVPPRFTRLHPGRKLTVPLTDVSMVTL